MQTLAARFPLPPVEFSFAGFTWPRHLATLPKGKPAKRLAARKVSACGPYYHAPKPVVGAHPGKGFYLDGTPGLRWVWCDDVDGVGRAIDHKGWFTDDDGTGETIRGLVFRLPGGRGFLIGWSMGEGMASAIDADVYPDEISAAHAANSLAENTAEKEREYQASQESELCDSCQCQLEPGQIGRCGDCQDNDDTEAKYRQYAIGHLTTDELEINEDAIVSIGDGGAFVAAWVWIPDSAL